MFCSVLFCSALFSLRDVFFPLVNALPCFMKASIYKQNNYISGLPRNNFKQDGPIVVLLYRPLFAQCQGIKTYCNCNNHFVNYSQMTNTGMLFKATRQCAFSSMYIVL